VRLKLVAVGRRMPSWVEAGVEDYRRRFSGGCTLEIVPVEAAPRRKTTDLGRAKAEEGARLLKAAEGCHKIALDIRGRPWSTEELAERLDHWIRHGTDTALIIGGADGLDPATLAACPEHWSLGPLTLPHPLVRLIVSEQLYRAWSLRQGHPYHRGAP